MESVTPPDGIEKLPAHVQRMVAEHATLQLRINAAKMFVSRDQFRELNLTDQSLLVAQIMAMDSYCTILGLRIDLATN